MNRGLGVVIANVVRMSRKPFTEVVACLTMLLAQGSIAAPITYGFSGLITSEQDPNGYLSISPGKTTFTGSFTYDPANPDKTLSLPNRSGYSIGPGNVTIGTKYPASTAPAGMSIENNVTPSPFSPPMDYMSVVVQSGKTIFPVSSAKRASNVAWGIELEDSSATAFKNTSLPTSLSLSSFDSASFFLQGTDPKDGFFSVGGEVTKLWQPRNYGLFIGVQDPGSWIKTDMRNDEVATALQKTFMAIPNYGDSKLLKADLSENNEGQSVKPITRGDLEDAIKSLSSAMVPGDKFFLYIGSHGGTFGERWFLPSFLEPGEETTASRGDEGLKLGDVLSDDTLYMLLKQYLSGYDKMLFLDACHAGGFWGNDNPNDLGDLEKLSKIGLLAAAAEDKDGYMNSSGKSVFGLALNSALQYTGSYMRADANRDGVLDLMEIANTIRNILADLPASQDYADPVLFPMGWGDPVEYSPDLFSVSAFRSDDLEDSLLAARVLNIPEPGTFVLVGLGLTGFVAGRRRR